MKKKINKITALLLFTLCSAEKRCSAADSLPEELSTAAFSSAATTTNALMSSVQNPLSATSKNSTGSSSATSFSLDNHPSDSEAGILYQPVAMDGEEVYLNFESVDLLSVAHYMENLHGVTFISDDVVTGGTTAASTGLQGHQVSFRMFKSVTKRQSWNLFIAFLKMAGFDLIPMAQAGFYKIVSFTAALNEALPTYIGVDRELLPDNDMMIRYVYFLQNSDVTTVQPLITQFQGSVGKIETYTDLKALIFIDKAYNIRSLMNIVIELDQAVAPQVVSVIKLQRALAADVITLYNALKPTETTAERAWAPLKKESSLQYFPADVILVSDARTNSLIVLGTEDAVTRIEDFIRNHVDEEIAYRQAPVYTYRLEYTNATDIQTILSSVVGYGSGTTTATYGGVLNGEKYFSAMNILADTTTNSLIINCSKNDYIALEKLIKQLDVPQKQIAFDFLLLQISNVDTRTLGSQISGARNSTGAVASTFLDKVAAQTSGIPSGTTVVANSTDSSIKASLASLLGSSNTIVNTAGSTLITFGRSIWGLLKIVQEIATTQIISNPFLVTTNNTQGTVSMGVTRQVITSNVYSTSSTSTTSIASGYESVTASLSITVTPQVNEDNIINLALTVNSSDFAVSTDPNSGNTNSKIITTNASLAAGEVLVVGGIVTENISSSSRGVPILESIPLLGWLFKSKQKIRTKDHYVVFVSPRIINAGESQGVIGAYTQEKINVARNYLNMMDALELGSVRKDPISKAFFGKLTSSSIDLFQEDTVAYKQAQRDRNALSNYVELENQKTSSKKKRSQVSSAAKKKRSTGSKKSRKNGDSKNGSSADASLSSDSSSGSAQNSSIELGQDDYDRAFLSSGFALTSDDLPTTSLFSAVAANQQEG
jgi:general secretion pathway protein D